MAFQHLILGLLRDGKRRYAFKIAKEYERLSGNRGYPANVGRELRKLDDEGLVTLEANAPGEDERRISYLTTKKGCQVFDDWLVSPTALDEDFSTWLLFVERVPTKTRDRLLERREEELWFLLKRVNRDREDALTHSERNGDEISTAAAVHLRWRSMQLSADLEFVRELRREFGNSAEKGTSPEDREGNR